jgi:hypothetical protein
MAEGAGWQCGVAAWLKQKGVGPVTHRRHQGQGEASVPLLPGETGDFCDAQIFGSGYSGKFRKSIRKV